MLQFLRSHRNQPPEVKPQVQTTSCFAIYPLLHFKYIPSVHFNAFMSSLGLFYLRAVEGSVLGITTCEEKRGLLFWKISNYQSHFALFPSFSLPWNNNGDFLCCCTGGAGDMQRSRSQNAIIHHLRRRRRPWTQPTCSRAELSRRLLFLNYYYLFAITCSFSYQMSHTGI